MEKQIFAFDFSMSKPAMCSLINDKLEMFIWPAQIDDPSYERLSMGNIHIYNRNLPEIKKHSFNEHELINEHLRRSTQLANMIADKIDELLTENDITDKSDVIIANEGFAFSAHGNAILDLAGYKYILLYTLMQHGYTNFRTYSAISIKKTAGCSKRGMGKVDMINALSTQNKGVHKFIELMKECPDVFKKKTAYVLCTDDIADSYWCLKTTINDLKMKSILDVE